MTPGAQVSSGKPPSGSLGILIALALVLVGIEGFALWRSMKGVQWEYTIVSPDDSDLSDELTQLGAAGWEVVAARRATSGSGYSSTASYEMILKRPASREAMARARMLSSLREDPVSPSVSPAP